MMAAGLRIVAPEAAAFCMPWRLRHPDKGPWYGGQCCYCGRDIAVPLRLKQCDMGCIYCGFDRDLIPLVEIEPWHEVDAISREGVT